LNPIEHFMNSPRVRKQIDELNAADFEAHPVWEHCLDEEGEPGQDEATVRPYDAGGKPLEYVGLVVVRSTLTLANGKRFPGYVYYAPELPAGVGMNYGPLANLQPHVITPYGQVSFWYGALAPTAETLAEAHRRLEVRPGEVFPARYASEVPLATGPLQGEIPGFQYIAEKKKGWLSKERFVATTTGAPPTGAQ
jgi:hypothetical protein